MMTPLQPPRTHPWRNGLAGLAMLFLVAYAIFLLAPPALAQQRNRTVYEIESKFQRITIVDTPNGYRQMIFDGKFDGTDAIQSEMNKANPNELTLSYAKHMITALPVIAKPSRIVVIGLGGACIQRYIRNLLPDVTIETAELDPAVLDVARVYFAFNQDDRQKVSLGDGRKFLEQSKDKYDVIMLDAFSATSIPYLLATKEFLTVCRDHLAEGGVVAANLWYDQADYHDMLKTYAAVFPEFHVIRCFNSSNAILLALPVKRDLTAEKWIDLAREFEKAHPTGLNVPQLIDRGIEPTTRIATDAKILLDADADKHK